jgi:filamentous hemagglutinin family protein
LFVINSAMNRFALLYGLAGGLIFWAGWLIKSDRAMADLIPDRTLPQPSRVTLAGRRAIITDGTRRGRNLFHSFREFSVAPGGSASFQGIDPTVTNVFARVTGRNSSRIHGLIETLDSSGQISSANLFLLNPNGILFGNNAALRIGGSFIATTANRINFADGAQFSAVRLQHAGWPPVWSQSGADCEPFDDIFARCIRQ